VYWPKDATKYKEQYEQLIEFAEDTEKYRIEIIYDNPLNVELVGLNENVFLHVFAPALSKYYLYFVRFYNTIMNLYPNPDSPTQKFNCEKLALQKFARCEKNKKIETSFS